ncbi:hypothetical protein RQP54_00925 [Curvibacter sp. APW13]|uniref:hypothetical protein n=1 Tax=Curvibacter sp. APW13 TaxID=3077236 RepID=UPI0028DF8AC5|nr:hypothetical protein [Curvibacter sp. APW13]MDT8989419.1 hypothetical protein [Curvibacter sp. APW13]
MPAPQQYAAHGAYDFEWKGEVLCIRFFGVFNIEAVEVFCTDLRQTVAQRGLTRWGRLADLRQWQGITPEGKEAYAALSDWYPGAGAVAHVQLYPSAFTQSMADTVNQSVARVGPVKQCDSVEEGLAWLQGFGLAITD